MQYKQLIIGLIVGLGLGAGISVGVAQDGKNDRPEVVMRDGLAPTRAAPSGDAQITILAEGEKAFMGKLRVAPGASLPEHTDESEEYLYVLEGTGTIKINGTDYEVKPQTGIFMPAGAKVSYENGDRVMTAIQTFAGPEAANKYSKWETGQEPLSNTPTRGGKKAGGR